MDVVIADRDDEALLLDLLNSTPVVDGVPTDALADVDAAAPWLAARGLGPQEHPDLIAARSVLQAVARGDRPASALEPLLAGVHLVATVDDAGVSWRPDPATGAVRAALAWDRLRILSPGRLRPCANTECRLFLIDRSKPNNARWCSMAVCGNRIKARRHYRRAST
jgi:predicted RNA-binding Zn ribbon-like protein